MRVTKALKISSTFSVVKSFNFQPFEITELTGLWLKPDKCAQTSLKNYSLCMKFVTIIIVEVVALETYTISITLHNNTVVLCEDKLYA